MYHDFGIGAFLARWLIAMALVLATYNPSGFSFCDWVADFSDHRWVLKLLVAIILVIGYGTFALATYRSLGRTGIIAWMLLFTVLVWFLYNIGLIGPLTPGAVITIALLIFANVFAVGISWSYLRLRLSGQSDTNNVTLRYP